MAECCPLSTVDTRNYEGKQRKLLLAMSLCAVFMVVETVGGHISNSLAIFTDAVHLLSDLASFVVNLLALHWARKAATRRYSYGYHRCEIVGALLSIFLVWLMTAFLVREAVDRLYEPPTINSLWMVGIAAVGVAVNVLMGLVLHDHHGLVQSHGHGEIHLHGGHTHSADLNMKAAFIHVLGDLIQSVGVLVAAALIWLRPEWSIADPLCTFLFSALVLGSTLYLLRDIFLVLMQSAPSNLDLDVMREALLKVDGVESITDLHVWCLVPGKPVLTAHIKGKPGAVTSCKELLCGRFHVDHSTIEIDC